MANNNRGFTLIEVLLSVMIISLLVGLSMPVYQSFQSRNDLDVNTQSVAEMLRRAQSYARSGNSDTTWGVHLTTGKLTLFAGGSYASRTTAKDETIDMPTSLIISGLTDVIFSKLNGTPSTTGSISLTGTANDTRTVTINDRGMVNY